MSDMQFRAVRKRADKSESERAVSYTHLDVYKRQQHDGGLIFTKVDPLLENLHNDPRFTALLKKLNLPN